MEAGNEALLQDILFQATNHVYQAMRSRILRGEPLGTTYDSEGHENYYVLEAADPTNASLNRSGPDASTSHSSLPSTPGASKYTFVSEMPGDGYREVHSAELSPPLASQTMSNAPSLATESTTSDTASPETPAHNLLQAIRDAHVTDEYPVEAPQSSKSPMKKASHLKRSYTQHQGRAPSGRRLMGDLDPENREIMRLRQDENLEFDEIARVLNKKRMKTGQPTTLTSNAIYSRYKRNAPLIAAAEGREFVPTARDQKKSGQSIQFSKATVVRGFDAEEDALLVQAVKDIDDRKWELVSARLQELGGKRHESEMCALRYHYL